MAEGLLVIDLKGQIGRNFNQASAGSAGGNGGRKRITLFGPECSPRLYRHPFTVRSYVDPERPDFRRFPGLAGVEGHQVVLEPGETLFIPSGFWHHVVYEEGGYSISLRCRSLGFFSSTAISLPSTMYSANSRIIASDLKVQPV